MTKPAITLAGGRASTLDTAHFEQLSASFRGELIRPGDKGYEEARTIWNATVDRRPALIARCKEAADIRGAVNFARESGLMISIRGGGHNIAGNAVCEGGVMIDLSLLRSVTIDPKSRRAHVEPGALLSDFDREAQAFGLATPLGINSTTGVAGLTLGGGFGWLTRKYGLTADNLISAEIITAEGKMLHASETENADLFWAIRGGGGNFGIISSFEFGLHPVGPEVYSGLVVYPFEQVDEVLKKYRQYVMSLTEETTIWVVCRKAPPLPFLDKKYHGKEVVVFACIHAGNPEEGKRSIEPVRKFGEPIGEHLGVQPYSDWQKAFDPLLTPGARNYWKSHNFISIPNGMIGVVKEYGSKLPTDECEIFFGMLGGEAGRKTVDYTAYPHRDADFVMNVHARWRNKEDDDKCIGWARSLFEASAAFASGSVYVNFMTADETGRIKAAYGPNYNRLLTVKRKYDPTNLFRMNQNISPE